MNIAQIRPETITKVAPLFCRKNKKYAEDTNPAQSEAEIAVQTTGQNAAKRADRKRTPRGLLAASLAACLPE